MKKKENEKNPPEANGYDAFISYKHSDFDSEICLTLHKQLESFKIKRGKETRKVKRVFLDTEELASAGSLSKSIQEALDNSRHLIVICSKDTPQSPWVKKEIEYFVAKHGYDKVLALLIDGEPHEAFPEPLKYANVDGILKEVEPLAADIRAENPKQSKKALKREILRLLAPLLGMTYDELRQRHQKMVIRRIIRTASLVAALLLSFGAYAFVQWQYTQEQNEIISAANAKIEENNRVISGQNDELTEKNDLITEQNRNVLALQSRYMAREALSLLQSGNRRMAIWLARAALPSSTADPDRPYVDEAAFAFSETLGVYTYPAGFFHFDAVFSHDSKVQDYIYDPQAEYITAATSTHLINRQIDSGEVIWSIPIFPAENTGISIDCSTDGSVIYTNALDGYLAAVNAGSGDVIWTSGVKDYAFNADISVCVGDDPANESWNPKYGLIDLSNGQVTQTYPADFGLFTNAIKLSPGGKYFSAESINSFIIIETETGQTVIADEYENYADVFLSDKLAVVVHRDYSDFLNVQNEIIIYDLSTGAGFAGFNAAGHYSDLYFVNDNLIVYAGISGFVIYDYITGEIVHTEAINWVQSNFMQGSLLFMASGYGYVYIYDAETGYHYEMYSFEFPSDTQKIISSRGIFSGSVGSDIHVRKQFVPPGFSEFDVYEAIFLENNRILTRGSDGDDSTVGLWQYTDNADGTVSTSQLSNLTLPYIFDFTFDSGNMTVYCVTDSDELYLISISDDELVLEKTLEARSFDTVHITQDGTPVLLSTRSAVISPGSPESIALEHSIYSADMIFKRNGSLIIAAPQEIEILTYGEQSAADGEPVVINTSDIYAVSPVEDECVYYKTGRLIFRELFTESERTVDVADFGKISALFYSPDGSLLFAATEALRLYAYDVAYDSFTEMEAEFFRLPKQAFHIGDYLAIRDMSNRVTLWNPETMKITGQTSILQGYGDGKLVISSGMRSGIVPLYNLTQMIELADEILPGYAFDEREIARYLS